MMKRLSFLMVAVLMVLTVPALLTGCEQIKEFLGFGTLEPGNDDNSDDINPPAPSIHHPAEEVVRAYFQYMLDGDLEAANNLAKGLQDNGGGSFYTNSFNVVEPYPADVCKVFLEGKFIEYRDGSMTFYHEESGKKYKILVRQDLKYGNWYVLYYLEA